MSVQQKPQYVQQIDLLKLLRYILKRFWLVAICAAIGFGGMYYRVAYMQTDTYAASGTMYVYNGNPNATNYQYISSSDLYAASELVNTYTVVIKSNKVMSAVVERLAPTYPNIDAAFIQGTLSMSSVSDTSVVMVTCTTTDPQLSADICNAVMDVSPSEIIRVVGAGSVEVIDYAEVPTRPVARGPLKKGMVGALAGAVLACGILVLLFLLNQKITDSKELESAYVPPVLASIRRDKGDEKNPSAFLLTSQSPVDKIEGYAKLRMNMLCTMVERRSNIVEITSSISGEGKSTIAANLALSCAMGGKSVLLIDGDMRRACQHDIFHYSADYPGLSDVLIGQAKWEECLLETNTKQMEILPAGHLPPNPSELLSSTKMKLVLAEMSKAYSLILIDVPPVNIVSDPLAISDQVAGCLFVVRQNYSDHREIKHALVAAELAELNILGFVFSGENLMNSKYYEKKYYKNYYNKYDNRKKADVKPVKDAEENKGATKDNA